MKIEVALHGRQIDYAEFPQARGIIGPLLRHDLAGALNDPAHAGLADVHVMRLFHQHEARGPRQGIEARFGQRAELELSITIREVSEHEKSQPIRGLFIESAQYSRVVEVARAALQQGLGLFAAVPTKIPMQQIHHGPEVTSLFDVDLKQIAQVVQRWTGESEMPLLFD